MRYIRAVLAVAALALAGCGGGAATSGDAAPRPTNPSPASSSTAASADGEVTTGAAASSIVPAVDVIDVNTGQSVALRTVMARDRPTLIWMWAPH